MPPSKEGAIITVINSLGQVVLTETYKNAGFGKHTLNLQDLAKGIYSINIAKGNEMSTQNFVIQ
jgi:hypothetical protein